MIYESFNVITFLCIVHTTFLPALSKNLYFYAPFMPVLCSNLSISSIQGSFKQISRYILIYVIN